MPTPICQVRLSECDVRHVISRVSVPSRSVPFRSVPLRLERCRSLPLSCRCLRLPFCLSRSRDHQRSVRPIGDRPPGPGPLRRYGQRRDLDGYPRTRKEAARPRRLGPARDPGGTDRGGLVAERRRAQVGTHLTQARNVHNGAPVLLATGPGPFCVCRKGNDSPRRIHRWPSVPTVLSALFVVFVFMVSAPERVPGRQVAAAAVAGGGGTLAAALLPSAAVVLGVVALGMLLIVAGVMFHSSEAPARWFERLIKAVRPAAGGRQWQRARAGPPYGEPGLSRCPRGSWPRGRWPAAPPARVGRGS